MSARTKVTILLGVYNGAAHLPAQLASIAGQSHRNWHLVCSDDGSIDQSAEILRRFSADHPGKVSILSGPQSGFSANYMNMVRHLPADAGYVALCDQDDIWLPDKLACAINLLAGTGATPALYAGRHMIWKSGGHKMRPSGITRRPCTFQNALAENVASGNTIVLSPHAATLARNAARRTGAVFAHDWWLYLLITGCGGVVRFDNGPPKILYRQHAGNVIGAGASLAHQLRRKLGVLRGSFMQRIDGNLDALSRVADILTPQARLLLADFIRARQQRGLYRLVALGRIGLYRQHWPGHIGFWGAASLGRV